MRALRYPKPAILAEIPKDRHTVIEASAGTGKTFTLEHLVVDLLLTTDTAISEILVVTFTERATSELRARVRAILLRLLELREEDAAGEEISDERCWILGTKERARLERALRQFDSATISTIHAFCQQILREHAFANQRLFSETNVDGREAFAEAFRETLRRELAVDPRHLPILDRWLAVHGLAELEAFLFDVARQRGSILPRLDYAGADEGRGEAAKGGGAAAAGDAAGERGAAGGGDGAGGDAAADLAAVDSQRISLEALVVQRFLPIVQARLASHKRERGLFDFDDMLSLVRDNLVGEHGDALVGILRGRYDFALIDEFQDTDEVQWEIFRRIFFESGGANRLYLIGDPKQAIYRFRGADVETYLAAKRELLEAGGARVALEQNFRSTGALIDGYNLILDQGAKAPFFTSNAGGTGEGIDYSEPVSCGNPALRLLGPDDEDAAPIHLFEVPLRKSARGRVLIGKEHILPPLGARIAAEIQAITDPKRPSLRFVNGKGVVEPVVHRDIYILCRAGSDGVAIGRSLRAAGVPHAFYKQDGLLQTAEARALHDLLAAVADPDDHSKRLRAWLSPFFELELGDLERVLDLPPSDPLVERLYDWKKEADERRFERLFSRIFDESGLTRRLIFAEGSDRELTNYLHLAELLLEAMGRSCRTLAELVALLHLWIEEEQKPEKEDGNQQRLESDRDAVQIMTMHSSKGLEAKVVFLVGGVGPLRGPQKKDLRVSGYHDKSGRRVTWLGELPKDVERIVNEEEGWEDQRLLYVALTRAKGRLYLPMYRAPDKAESVLTGGYRGLDARLLALSAGAGASEELAGQGQGRGSRAHANGARSGGAGPAAGSELALPAQGTAGWAPGQVSVDRIDLDQVAEEEDARVAKGSWEPALSLFSAVDRSEQAAALRVAHRGYRVTSYTQMKPGGAPRTVHDPERDDFAGEAAGPLVAGSLPAGKIPGGAGTGIFLHELLAKVPPELVLQAPSAEALASIPAVATILRQEAARAGIDASHLPHAASLLHTSLAAKVRLRDGRLLEGIAAAPTLLREMEFLFPIPERSHPRLSEAISSAQGGAPLPIRRGFVKGFVDLLFEHDGLAYFGDWKSDVLPSYSAEGIAERTEQSYRLQAKLYSLALVKMLELRDEAAYEKRFGGFLYLFVRGMQLDGDSNEGIHFERPSWSELLEWELELLGRDDLEGVA